MSSRALVPAHLRALASTRATLGYGLAAFGLALAGLVVNIAAGELPDATTVRDVLSGGGLIQLVLLAFAAVAAAGEVQYGTTRALTLAAGRHPRLPVSEIGALLIAGTVIGGGAVAICLGVGAIWLELGDKAELPSTWELARLWIGGTVASALAAGLGASIGIVVGRVGAATAAVLIGVLAVDPALSAVIGVVDRLGVGGVSASLVGLASEDSLSQPVAILVAGAWIAVGATIAVMSQRRREL